MFSQLRGDRLKTLLYGSLLLFVVTLHVPDAVNGRMALPAPLASATSGAGDASIWANGPVAYTAANILPSRVVQVDLAQYPKISQFTDIDSSAQGFGREACGLVAAASAMGGKDWVPLVGKIAAAAGQDYSAHTGIQPAEYVAALQKVFGAENVTAMNASTLDELYQALQAGKIVIVDIKVNATNVFPSADGPTYSHFARVLGIDPAKQEIYIANTLGGSAYWMVSLADFEKAWELPETSASLVPDPQHAEAVTNWAVVLNPASLRADSGNTTAAKSSDPLNPFS
jgi:hypothetical protein